MNRSTGLVQTILPPYLRRWLERRAKLEGSTLGACLRRIVIEAATMKPDRELGTELAQRMDRLEERFAYHDANQERHLTPKAKRRIAPSPAARRSTAKKSTR